MAVRPVPLNQTFALRGPENRDSGVLLVSSPQNSFAQPLKRPLEARLGDRLKAFGKRRTFGRNQ